MHGWVDDFSYILFCIFNWYTWNADANLPGYETVQQRPFKSNCNILGWEKQNEIIINI